MTAHLFDIPVVNYKKPLRSVAASQGMTVPIVIDFNDYVVVAQTTLGIKFNMLAQNSTPLLPRGIVGLQIDTSDRVSVVTGFITYVYFGDTGCSTIVDYQTVQNLSVFTNQLEFYLFFSIGGPTDLRDFTVNVIVTDFPLVPFVFDALIN